MSDNNITTENQFEGDKVPRSNKFPVLELTNLTDREIEVCAHMQKTIDDQLSKPLEERKSQS